MWAHPLGGSEQLRGAAIATMEQQLIHGKHQLNSHMLPFFCCRSRAQPPSARILTFLVWQLCWHTDTHRHSYLGSCGPSPTNGEGRARRFSPARPPGGKASCMLCSADLKHSHHRAELDLAEATQGLLRKLTLPRQRIFTCLMLKSPEDTVRSGFGVSCQTGLQPD